MSDYFWASLEFSAISGQGNTLSSTEKLHPLAASQWSQFFMPFVSMYKGIYEINLNRDNFQNRFLRTIFHLISNNFSSDFGHWSAIFQEWMICILFVNRMQ